MLIFTSRKHSKICTHWMGMYYLSEKLSQISVMEHSCAQGRVLYSLSAAETPTVIYEGKSPLSPKLLLSLSRHKQKYRTRQKYACIL